VKEKYWYVAIHISHEDTAPFLISPDMSNLLSITYRQTKKKKRKKERKKPQKVMLSVNGWQTPGAFVCALAVM
jgi:hypothetical protein